MNDKKIIWLASYPKSGNTWLRILLTFYFKDDTEEFDLNNLITDGIASTRSIFEEATGLSSSDLSKKEIDRLRPDVYRYMAKKSDIPVYLKVHDANIKKPDNNYLIPEDVTLKVIYLIRNPLDVAVSLAFHSSVEIDRAVDFICDEKATFCSNNRLFTLQLEQKLLSWNGHVKSWTKNNSLDVMVIRYEDLLNDTFFEMEKTFAFLEMDVNKNKLQSAVKSSNFERIKSLEKEKGFREKALRSESFFRKGISGDGINHLSGFHVERIKRYNLEMMKKYGYR